MLRTVEDQEENRRAEAARRGVYSDVETLVMPGFLAHDVIVGDIAISMRSLCPGDTMLLKHRVGLRKSNLVWKRWVVASSIWMVDGQPLLESPHATSRIYKALTRLPRIALDILFSIVMGLVNRTNKAVEIIEAYCYESHSRSRWQGLRGLQPNDEKITGIPGSGRMGQNAIQRIWIIFHKAEDEHADWLRHWQAAKFVASAHNSKGVKKVSTKDDSQTKAEKSRRQRVIDETCWRATGGLPGLDQPRLYRAVTAEDLVDEMKRWVAGEHDFHDTVVTDYKEKIRLKMAEEKQRKIDQDEARIQARMAADASFDPETAKPRPLVGYTLEQLAQITQGRPGGRKTGGSVVFEGSNMNYVYDKFVDQEIQAGSLSTDGKAVPTEREQGGPSTLQQKIAGRKVTMTPPPKTDGGS
jgi:hypothetical protein